MVRVNYPPGGHTMFQAETSRAPQTVRILQPPGGSSSISFSDDSQAQNGSRSSSEKITSPSSSANTQEPNFDSKPEGNTSPSSHDDSANQNGIKGKISDEKVPDLSDEAVNVTLNISEELVENVKQDNESKEFPLPKDFEDSPSRSFDKSVSENKEVKEVEVSESFSEKQSEVVSEVSETSCVSSSTESSETSKVEISSISENQTEEVINDSVSAVSVKEESNSTSKVSESEKIVEKKESNGVDRNQDLPPLHIQRNDSSSATTATPSPSVSSPPIRPNDDIKNRVIGQPQEVPLPQQAPPRKIKDHMRSNIFMSDEDYMPVRSSRMNATVNDTKQDVPAAGQRQRIPPGGFSTKLW